MTTPLSADQTNDVTSHHKAGHLCVLVKANIPFSHFQRLPSGNSHLMPDTSYQAENLEELYACYLAIRASRFSQRLSPYNNAQIESESFGKPDEPGDDQDLEARSHHLFRRFHQQWTNNQPNEQEFHRQLLAVADEVLGQAYQDAAYTKFVQGVASALMASNSLSREELYQLVEDQWNRSGATTELFNQEKFGAVCTGTGI